jgi:glutamate racemase
MSNLPIGIFDSGVGGLTVAKEIVRLLPHESIIYLGDTARVPYGSRDKQTIITYSLQLTNFLLQKNVKVLVIACNTISAVALDEIKKISPVPVIDVIQPTVAKAVAITKNNHIGVIGTQATIESETYKQAIVIHNRSTLVESHACPLFVPIAENALSKQKVAKETAKDYLTAINQSTIDTLILGCTHYPLLYPLISQALRTDIMIVDSGIPTAEKLQTVLQDHNLLNDTKQSFHQFFVTGDPIKAQKIARVFFGEKFTEMFQKIQLI